MPRRFELVEEISRHGRAILYRARDADLDELVTLRRYLGAPAELEPLAAALAELASLQHPNLEHFREIGEDDQGLFAIVEAPWGESLTDMLKRGPLTVAEFEQVAQQLMAALCAMHEAGYPHLALRPGVVRIVTDPSGKLEVRLTGFGEGFGRSGQAQPPDTKAYRCCAPEHWRGEPVGRRTDVYALGCILYEALAGRPAFQGNTTENMRSAHLEHDVAPLDRVAPHAPRWMTAWVMHLMEPASDARLKNAMQARELYEQREAGLAITAAPPLGEPKPAPETPSFGQPGYPYQTVASVPSAHPVTAEIRAARATSTAVPVVIQGAGVFRRPAAPLRPAAKRAAPAALPTTKRSKEELRVLLSIAVAVVCVAAIIIYLLTTRQAAQKEKRASAESGTLPVVAGLMLQLDADQAETVFREAKRGRIRRWKNAAGKPPHLEQSDSNAMPLFLSKGLGGKSTLDFGPTNSGQWMAFTDNEGKAMKMTAIRTVFWVLKGSNFLLTNDSTTHFHRGEPEGSSTAKILRAAEAATMAVRLNGKEVSAATTSLPGDYSIISAVTTQPLEASRLCNDRNESGRKGGQEIAEILIYNRPLDAAELTRVEAYLRRKWFGP